ncbi:MAG: ThiF family adenylyltransferase [Spongiibacteraceae bacterium]
MISSGQAWAFEQLEEIAAESTGTLEIVERVENENGYLKISVSIDCRHYAWAEGGIRFRPRERFTIFIPSLFPLEIPELSFSHNDYADFPHVQWRRSICLYQSKETEWQPDDGMFGFMQRVHDWLTAGATNQLEPIGLPLHPPVAYPQESTIAVVPTQNTPTPQPPWWTGYAKIERENDDCIELGEWLESNQVAIGTRVAPAILLPHEMPYEYPTTVAALKTVLESRGISIEVVRLLLCCGALHNTENKALIFLLGAAMRGIAGGERRQHLAAWQIKQEHALELRTAVLAATKENPVDEQLFREWTERATINWCSVLEDRPEIVIQRDTGTPAQFWRGKHVAILGCGAIGSTLAMLLARAGVGKLQLYDKALVKPGLLVRQLFDRYQIGYGKARATRINARYINPKIDVTAHHKNILNLLSSEESLKTLFEADIIIDATASSRITGALEFNLRDRLHSYPPILSMAIGHKADMGLMTLAQSDIAGVAYDLDRRLKLEFADSFNGQHFLDEFWPTNNRTQLFQPEPGCSDPTFIGSATDVTVLVSRMLNVASGWLAQNIKDRAYGFGMYLSSAPHTTIGIPPEAEYIWEPDDIYIDGLRGYQIRVAPSAKATMLSWMRKSERRRGMDFETGGILFGQINDFLKIIWVTAASGPPPDSIASRDRFICGTRGVPQMNTEYATRSRGSVSFIGMWHTHPGNKPDPSAVDRESMAQLFANPNFKSRHFLMLIIGDSSDKPSFGGSLFEREL